MVHFIALLSFLDNAVSRCQKHGMGVIRWKEKTRDLPRRQVCLHTAPAHMDAATAKSIDDNEWGRVNNG